jgi:4-amino-4-deoxy-L-arabinose transferase-like glycosyltransferase
VLAVGAFFGAPWLVNPILAGANILLAYVLVRELYDRRTARLAILLLSASPWLLFMGMNFMTHTLTLTAALAAAVCVARMRRSRRIAWAVPGGLATGFLALLRPLEALIVAVLLGAWSLFESGGRLRFGRTAVLAGASVLGAAITFPYNRAFTGRATYFPLIAYTDAQYGVGSNALGFGAARGLGWPGLDPLPGHGAMDVVVNALLNSYQVGTELFGWATGSLVLLALFFAARGGRWRRADAGMVAAILVVIGAHSFYWFSGGPDFGARYWFLIVVPCVVLSVRGAQRLGQSGRHAEARAIAAVLALSLAAVAVFVPWRAADKYHHYRFMRPDVRALAATHGFDGGLVLVQGYRHPDYASAAAYNPVDLRGAEPVYAWDRSPEVRRAVLLAYADRPVWIVEGPTVTGAGYRVARGPLPAARLLSELDRGATTPTGPRALSAEGSL